MALIHAATDVVPFGTGPDRVAHVSAAIAGVNNGTVAAEARIPVSTTRLKYDIALISSGIGRPLT